MTFMSVMCDYQYCPEDKQKSNEGGSMKTLYLSDLDGTLLRSDESISEFTAQTLQRLTRQGILFSYATARSSVTAKQVTRGLLSLNPTIVYNGAFIKEKEDGAILCENFFLPAEGAAVQAVLQTHQINPIVYAFVDGAEHFSFHTGKVLPVMKTFLDDRWDSRRREVADDTALYAGRTFYYTCVGQREQLDNAYDVFKNDDRFTTVYSKDTYMDAMLLEIMPKKATKANAALQLKERLKADKLVVFGDGLNDLSMFRAADEAYAVENAVPELKAAATGIIGKNDEDGVARWMVENS